MGKFWLFLPLFCLFFIAGCSSTKPADYSSNGPAGNERIDVPAEREVTSDVPTAPSLVILISVDQMRYDFLTRFKPYYKHGLKRLIDEGAVFSNAHHEHAITHTAPGHASISTGTYPSKHGIMENDFYNPVSGQIEYCVVDPEVEIIGVENDGALEGKSPENLKRNTIGDWLKRSNKKSKTFSVAFKDRASILLGGQNANRAYWFDNITTRFVSSTYYKEDIPEWVSSFEGKTIMAKELEEGWLKKYPEEVYKVSREDNFFVENGQFLPSFPHTKKLIVGRVNPAMKDAILLWTSPFGDALTLEFAQRLILEENLGKDEHPDLLTIGCSTADAIGHHFGPYSQEVQDYYLRLDEYLGNFFTFLDQELGKDNYAVALSSDHGVLPMPEELKKRGVDSKRILMEEFNEAIEKAVQEISQELELTQPVLRIFGSTGFSLNYGEAYEKQISPDELQAKLAEKLEKLDFVEEVYTSRELQKKAKDDYYLTLFKRSTRDDRGFELKVRYKENYLVNYRSNGTSHGSPYSYDTQVPVIFWGKAFQAGIHSERVATVDVAPTLAKLLGVNAPRSVDGQVIGQGWKK